MRKITLILTIAVFGALGVSAQSHKVIGMNRAKAIALKQTTGKVKHSKLVRENGKEFYAFEIRNNNKTELTRVKVDALNGDIIDSNTETIAKVNKPHQKKHWWIF